jgi:RNA polymerase sigma-70 factor (ECF subfamily)
MVNKSKLLNWFGKSATDTDFEELYHAELPRVYNFFRYRFGDGQLAEDLTSETFEKAWRNRHRYQRNLSAFSTWLFSIARRLAVDHYRKGHLDISLTDLCHLPSDEDLEGRAQQQVDFTRLSILLAGLADRERKLVALKYGAGLTNRAIAGLTGTSESNVGVILFRAVQTLREKGDVQHE